MARRPFSSTSPSACGAHDALRVKRTRTPFWNAAARWAASKQSADSIQLIFTGDGMDTHFLQLPERDLQYPAASQYQCLEPCMASAHAQTVCVTPECASTLPRDLQLLVSTALANSSHRLQPEEATHFQWLVPGSCSKHQDATKSVVCKQRKSSMVSSSWRWFR